MTDSDGVNQYKMINVKAPSDHDACIGEGRTDRLMLCNPQNKYDCFQAQGKHSDVLMSLLLELLKQNRCSSFR
jgi:hypothetical protein